MLLTARGGNHMAISPRSWKRKPLPPNSRILRWPEVKKRVGICRSYVHSLVAQGKFPPPIKLGERASGWIDGEIDDWINERVSISETNRVA